MARWSDQIAGTVYYPTASVEGHSQELRAAALDHRRMLAPANPEEVNDLLVALRTTTIARNESSAEAVMSFRVIANHLAKVPLDILKDALHRYVAAPGKRFFPRSPGELTEFTNPALLGRMHTAYRLEKMADHAEYLERETARINDPGGGWSGEDIRLLTPSMRQTAMRKGWVTQAEIDRALAEEEDA